MDVFDGQGFYLFTKNTHNVSNLVHLGKKIVDVDKQKKIPLSTLWVHMSNNSQSIRIKISKHDK